jgi:hypothetical protein
MKYIKGYQSFNEVNEEFIFSAIKGALAKVMQAFSNTFKDFANDFKNTFKPDDPNSIKNIILTNFNQAVDAAQKMLGGKEVDENGVNTLMNTMIESLEQFANGLDKDVDTALGKNKSAGAKAIAKAVLLGSKEAKWPGIVGLLDPAKNVSGVKTNYKYSKSAYETALTNAGKVGGANALKARKDAAIKFLDDMQKDIVNQLNNGFSEEEVKRIYDDVMKKVGQMPEYKEGDTVVYKRDKFDQKKWDALTDDDKKKPNEGKMKDLQADSIGIKKISKIEGDKVSFEGADFTKTIGDILMKIEGTETEEAKKAAESLAKIKNDPDKMKKVATFSEFLQDEKNKDKIAEIEKIMTDEGEGGS